MQCNPGYGPLPTGGDEGTCLEVSGQSSKLRLVCFWRAHASDHVLQPRAQCGKGKDKIQFCSEYNPDCSCKACEDGYKLEDGKCAKVSSGPA